MVLEVSWEHADVSERKKNEVRDAVELLVCSGTVIKDKADMIAVSAVH